MKQRKLTPVPARPNEAAKPAPKTSTTRQEIDTCVKTLAQHIAKDPKKAAKIFEGWLDTPSKSSKKKQAA